MKNKLSYAIIFLLLITGTLGCKKDKLRPINQEELITNVMITLVDSANAQDTVIFSFEDLDGEGGLDPVVTAGNFSANTTYYAEVIMLDQSQVPLTIVSEEVLEEGTDHQFFFLPTPGSLFSDFKYLDEDENGQPIGLSFSFKTGNAAIGNFTVVLRHQPEKNGLYVNEGDISNANGETDLEVTFPVSIL